MERAHKTVKMPMDEKHQKRKCGVVKAKIKRRKKCHAELWNAFRQHQKAL